MGLALPTTPSGTHHTDFTTAAPPGGVTVMADRSDPNEARITYEEADGWLYVEGMALPFDEVYDHPFRGKICFARDAFDQNLDAISKGDAIAYFAADDHRTGGTTLHAKTSIAVGEGSMRYRATDEGLILEAELVDDVFGRAIFRRITLGILDKLSVGVIGTSYDLLENEDGERDGIRYTEVSLRETSAVAYPAFKRTWLRSAEQQLARLTAETATLPADPPPDTPTPPETAADGPHSWVDKLFTPPTTP